MARGDLKINDNFELVVDEDGDFDIDPDATLYDAKVILNIAPGELKADGTVGVNLPGRINGSETPAELIELEGLIKAQLAADGITIQTIDLQASPKIITVDGQI